MRCRCLGAQKLLRTADLTVVIGVPALAVNQGWWFRSAGAPKPQSDMSVITAGRSAGIDWTLSAYATQNKEAGLKDCHRLPARHPRSPNTQPQLAKKTASQSQDPLLYPLSYGGSLGRVALPSHGLDWAPGSLRRGSAAQVSLAGGDCSVVGRNSPR